jgi:DNA-binding LacI/PurR family transcriptional regulator
MSNERRERRVTSADVAQEAGVSRSTVSYVLNDTRHQSIPESTRQRVLDAAGRLGYAPSAAARTLRRGRSDIVLCLLPDWPLGEPAARFLQELSAAFAANGLTFLTHPRIAGTRPIAEVWKAITPAAVLALEALDRDEAVAMRAAGVGVVVLAFGPSGADGEIVMSEGPTGRAQAEYLAGASHRQLGFAYPADARLRNIADSRLAGVADTCARLGLPAPVVQQVDLNVASAIEAINAWRSADPRVSAVCAYNDDAALAILAGMHALGLRAPADLAVIGADDIQAAALAIPALTTIATDLAGEAVTVAQAVADALLGDTSRAVLEVGKVAVVVRKSS